MPIFQAMSDIFSLDDETQYLADSMTSPDWLGSLNEEQREAVTTVNGPVLVLSGAGTGKTRVLTTRLAHILATEQVNPWNCLAVTFTNRAAQQMRERVGEMIGPASNSVWCGTFHALCARILRYNAEAIGFDSNFTIIDPDDALRLIKQIMAEEGIDDKNLPPKSVLATIERWKDKGLAPKAVERNSDGLNFGITADIYALYQTRLKKLNACDFGDLLLHCITMFQQKKDILEKYQEQFRYILVDEYQDTNVAQYLWLRLLSQKHKNLCCVGDDDQSIYSWRGAEVGNILRFEQDFKDAKVIRLETNYRSTEHILGAASMLIAHNEERLGKTLRTSPDKEFSGEKVKVMPVGDGREEARKIIEEIEDLQRKGSSLSQIAILVRAGFQTREFEERLISESVPYRVIGGPRFYERMEIRDALAYLRLISQPADDLAFERIINKPKRKLGKSSIDKIRGFADEYDISMFEAAKRIIETDEIKKQAKDSLANFVAMVQNWQSLLNEMPAFELVSLMLEDSGYMAMWEADKAIEAKGRVENLRELVSSVGEKFDSLQEFLEHVALVMENDENADIDRVSLMTLHAAKGLEFDCVFLPGWEEGLFPHQRSMDEGGSKSLEEERRLAHVGITRARKKVMITHAAYRVVHGQGQNNMPSRFIGELPSAHAEIVGSVYNMNGQRAQSGSWSWGSNKKPQNKPSWAGVRKKIAGKSDNGFRAGTKVFHEKFGTGTVLSANGEKLSVIFEKVGPKKIMAGFVKKV